MNNLTNSNRLMSLDALRGFDMLFIMGLGTFFMGLEVLMPENAFFKELSLQMNHVGWEGLRIEDCIFPLFLFIAGISFPFSLAKQKEHGKSESEIMNKVIRRGLTLVIFGVIYNGFLRDLDFAHQRYCSVLGRIGLAWMFGALVFLKTKLRPRIIIMVSTLILYWLLLALVPSPEAGDWGVFTKEGNIASYIDRIILPGRLFKGIHDPEGLMGTFPAMVTALLGMQTGVWIKSTKFAVSESKKALYLFLAGILLIVIGLIWNTFFPICKNLWTSSFVCVVGGISACLFALFYYVIDVRKVQKWTFFFRVIGMNSITIYLLQEFVDFKKITEFFFGGIIKMLPETAQPASSAIGYIIICWLLLYYLYKKRIFLKV